MNPNNMDIRPDHYGLICRISQQHLKEGSKVYAFGSRVKWTAKDNSDLDLLISPSQNLSALKEAFEESSLPYTVDVLDAQTIPPHFLEEIKSHRVPLLYDWKTVRLGEVTNIIDGDRGKQYPKQAEFFKSGYCIFLNTKNLPDTTFDFSNTQFITQLKDESLRKGRLERGDIVLTTRGTLGNLAHYNNNIPYNNIRINSGMVILRNNNLNINTNYLFMVLKSPLFKEFVSSTKSGSAQPQLPIRDLQTFKLPLPPLAEQERIASILSAFDDKIETNRKICADLEAAAKLIFRRDFIANPEAEGWEVVKLGDYFNFAKGKKPSIIKNTASDSTPFSYLTIGVLESNEELYGDSGVFSDCGNLIMVMDGASSGRVYWGQEGIISSTCSKIEIVSNKFGLWTLFNILKSNESEIMAHTTGSAIPHTDKGYVQNISIPLPPQALLETFEKTVAPLYGQIKNLQSENRTLAQARDLLLPKLMRGER